MRQSLRICQVSAAYYPYPSGVSEIVHHLGLTLKERGHDVQILTINYPQLAVAEHASSPACCIAGRPDELAVTRVGRAHLVPLNRAVATVPFGWHISGDVKRFLQAGRFDILHLHGTYPPDVSFWALRHSRSAAMVTLHTVGFVTNPVAAWLSSRLMARYNRKLGFRVVLSQASLAFNRPYLPGEYRIIRSGIDPRRFNALVPPIPELQGTEPRILFVGRFDRRKGLTVLIEALPSIARQLPGVRLIVVGRGPLEDEARQLVARLGVADRVQFQGFAANEMLPRYYVSADVYCAPSLGGEGFGVVLLEAMASGTPVVATDITGYNEVVKDGHNGVLCPAGNPQALADTLIRILTDTQLRARLRAGGLAFAGQCSWDRVAEDYENLYFELLARR